MWCTSSRSLMNWWFFSRSNSSSIETPPELPAKCRPPFSRSQAVASSSTDSLDNSFSTSYKLSNDGTYSTRPRSALIAGHLTRIDNYEGVRPAGMSYARSERAGNSAGQLFSSHDSIDGPVGKRSSVISNSSQSSAGYSTQSKALSDISERMHSNAGAPLAQLEDLSPIQPITTRINPRYAFGIGTLPDWCWSLLVELN